MRQRRLVLAGVVLAALGFALTAVTVIGPAALTPRHGLGALTGDAIHAPDISWIYRLLGRKPTPPDGLPSAYTVSNLPPVLDQGTSPMCVAYSAATVKAWQDRRDQGRFFTFDTARFFDAIGGGADGAYVGNSLAYQKATGYPASGSTPALHRIASFASVSATPSALMTAIYDTGVLQARFPWYTSWFTPNAQGVLPKPDTQVGGHAIAVVGYNSVGLVLQNSWGTGWGDNGRATLPWAYVGRGTYWSVMDVIDTPSPTPTPRPVVTPSPTPSASSSPTDAPTDSPTPSDTAAPVTPAPTPVVTDVPTPEPSFAPVEPGNPGTLDRGRLLLVFAALAVAAGVLAWTGRKHLED